MGSIPTLVTIFGTYMQSNRTVHFGNGNYKLKKAACGITLISYTNAGFTPKSVAVKTVSCIACIEAVLKRQKAPNSKTEGWKKRLVHLREKSC